jgi:hypothetical protein
MDTVFSFCPGLRVLCASLPLVKALGEGKGGAAGQGSLR